MKEYTINFLFTTGLSQVLLVRKGRTAFKGMLNGVGGELEPGETAYGCAMREIAEETGLDGSNLVTLDDGNCLAHLGTLELPQDCKYGTDAGCRLHYFAGVILPRNERLVRPAAEELVFRYADDVVRSGTESREYAGNGDVPYFIAAGARALKQATRYHGAYAADNPGTGLAGMLALHRGYMDRAFREGDLREAAEEAATVSRLAYAVWSYGPRKEKTDAAKTEKDG